MTINSAQAFVASLWDWSILSGCFGTDRDRVGDIDGHIERRGYHLFLETKLPGAKIQTGQLIAYRELSRLMHPQHSGQLPSVIVLVVWGHPGQPQECQFIMRGQAGAIQSCSTQRLRRIVSRWHALASEFQRQD